MSIDEGTTFDLDLNTPFFTFGEHGTPYYGVMSDQERCVHGARIATGLACQPCMDKHLAEAKAFHDESVLGLRWLLFNEFTWRDREADAAKAGVSVERLHHLAVMLNEWGWLTTDTTWAPLIAEACVAEDIPIPSK